MDTCYCPIGEPEERPPTEEEFLETYDEEVRFLVDDKKLTLVTSVEDVVEVVPECFSNEDCGAGEECFWNTCVPLPLNSPEIRLIWFGDGTLCYYAIGNLFLLSIRTN
jgi:hypothetical protein